MGFQCQTTLYCDSMEISAKERGWIKILGKYNICRECVEHYGRNHLIQTMEQMEQPVIL